MQIANARVPAIIRLDESKLPKSNEFRNYVQPSGTVNYLQTHVSRPLYSVKAIYNLTSLKKSCNDAYKVMQLCLNIFYRILKQRRTVANNFWDSMLAVELADKNGSQA